MILILERKNKGEVQVIVTIPETDYQNIDKIKIECRAETSIPLGGMRLYIEDDQTQSIFAYVEGISEEMKEITLSQNQIFGILARPQAVKIITFKFWGRPWYYGKQDTKPHTGRVIIKSFTFVPKAH